MVLRPPFPWLVSLYQRRAEPSKNQEKKLSILRYKVYQKSYAYDYTYYIAVTLINKGVMGSKREKKLGSGYTLYVGF